MLSKSDEDILDERLRNWGRWCATKRHISSNMIFRMMMLYGEREPGDQVATAEESYSPPDIQDALFVNRAWQRLPERPPRYQIAKRVLVAHYAFPGLPLYVACRQLGLRERDYWELLRLAKYMIFNRLEQHASKKLSVM